MFSGSCFSFVSFHNQRYPVTAGLGGEGESKAGSWVPAPSGLCGLLKKAFEAAVAVWSKDKHYTTLIIEKEA